jgi:hypothetical protein
MCLFQLLRISYRRGKHSHGPVENITTGDHGTTFRRCSISPRQENVTSLSQLACFGSGPLCASHSTSTSCSDDSSTSTLYSCSDSNSTLDHDTIYSEDAFEWNDNLDSASFVSQASSTLTVCGSVNHMSLPSAVKVSDCSGSNSAAQDSTRVMAPHRKDEAIKHTVRMSASQGRRSTIKGCKVAKSISDGLTAGSASTSVRALHNGQSGRSHNCYIGVLSAFGEEHLCKEDKEAIIQGGCHGLCSTRHSIPVNVQYTELVNGTGSAKISPCIKNPHDKSARFVSTMPSNITSNGRRGPTSTQPRFSRRRIAAEYKQPRQALPVAERPVRKVRFDPALPPTPSEIADMKPSQPIHSQQTGNFTQLRTTPTLAPQTSPMQQGSSINLAPLYIDNKSRSFTFEAKQESDKNTEETALKHGTQQQGAPKPEKDSLNEKGKKNRVRRGKAWNRFPGIFGGRERVSEACWSRRTSGMTGKQGTWRISDEKALLQSKPDGEADSKTAKHGFDWKGETTGISDIGRKDAETRKTSRGDSTWLLQRRTTRNKMSSDASFGREKTW